MPREMAFIRDLRGLLPARFAEAEAARQLGRMLAVYGLVGVVGGLMAALFHWTVVRLSDLLLVSTVGVNPSASGWESGPVNASWPDLNRLWILLIPAAGALVAGIVSARFAPETMGTGTDLVIETYHRQGGRLRRRVPWVKLLSSSATVGTGGSAGVEGPVGAIVAGMGSLIGRMLKADVTEQRRLLMAGFAAGIGAVFHTPMGASILAAEVLYRDLDIEHEVLVPSIIASTVAYGTYGVVAGWEPIWLIPPVGFHSILELGPYLVLAIVAAAGGRLFIRIHHFIHHHIGAQRRFPLWLRPAVGGLGVGAVGLFVPQALGGGYGIAQAAIDGSAPIWILLLLALTKMLTSSLTAGSGGSGGLFAPSLVIGAAIGGAVGLATNMIWPSLDVSPAAFAIVGMAGFFSAVLNAPLSTVIMVSELAGSYRLLVPTLWVAIVAWSVDRKRSLYDAQVDSRLEAPGHLADMMDAVLRRIRVREAMTPGGSPPVTVAPSMHLRELVAVFASSQQAVFPVVDGGRLRGVVDGRQLRRTLGAVGIDDVLIARDFQAKALTTELDASLYDAVSAMAASGYDDILVVDDEDSSRLVGILSRREIVNAYHRRMLETAAGATGKGAASEAATGDAADGPPATDLVAALERGGVLVGLDGHDRQEILQAIVDRAELPGLCDREALTSRLLEREALGSTNIGGGIALPHPGTHALQGLSEPRVVIALLRSPRPWAESDPEPVDTVCMLLAPEGEVHLALVGALARSLSDPGLQQLLRERASTEAIMGRFRELNRTLETQ
ncbi:MAG: chloride channel protein [Deltaproteobacteria bacterium]|nr:chloride channel protein [Deltaproteobacteria bacterium]